MAELPQLAVDQAYEYDDSDGPVKVAYFMSRPEIPDRREAPFYCMSTGMPNLSKHAVQISSSVSSAAVAEERLLNDGDQQEVPIQVLAAFATLAEWAKLPKLRSFDSAEVGESKDSGTEKTKGDSKSFKDQVISVFTAVAANFRDSKHKLVIVPVGFENINGIKHRELGHIKASREASILLTILSAIKENLPDSQDAGPQEGENHDQKVTGNQNSGPKSNKEERKLKKPNFLDKAKHSFTDVLLPRIRDGRAKIKKQKKYEYALVCGITTQFNPGGMWIVEEFCNDRED